MPLFARFLCQVQILILEILEVFLWLRFSPCLNSNKNIRFSKVSIDVSSGLEAEAWALCVEGYYSKLKKNLQPLKQVGIKNLFPNFCVGFF